MIVRVRGTGVAAPTVVKFGGPALRYPAAIVAAVQRRQARGLLAIVASARYGVTDLLEQVTAEGTGIASDEVLEELRHRHPSPARSVHVELEKAAALFGQRPIRAVPRSWWREEVRSVGERLAVRWLAEELRTRGSFATSLDADRTGLRVGGPPGRGTIDVAGSRRGVRRAFHLAWAADRIPILTGYFGRTRANHVNTVGRNGSDYTATALGELLRASRVELVKPGVALRDANSLLRRTAPEGARLPYSDAERLARSGSGILHPRSVGPARRSAIPLGLVALRGSRDFDLWFGATPTGTARDGSWVLREMLRPEPIPAEPDSPLGALAP